MYLCNSQACLCNTKSVSMGGLCPFSVQMAQWSAWQGYPGQLGNRDCSRTHGPELFTSCKPDKAVTTTGAARLSSSPGMPGGHYLALNYSKCSVIRLERKIYLRGICKDARGGCPGRRTLPCPCQQGRCVADVKGSIPPSAHLLLILPEGLHTSLLTKVLSEFSTHGDWGGRVGGLNTCPGLLLRGARTWLGGDRGREKIFLSPAG